MLSGRAISAIAREFGLDRNALMRHRDAHMADAMRDAAEEARAGGEPRRLGSIEGDVLLGQAAEMYQRAMSTLQDLEVPGQDQRARVSALREVRACLEFLAKLSFQVEDRGAGKITQTEAPAIDAAIIAALEARGVGVEETAPSAARSEGPREPLALESGSSPADE